MTPLINKEIKSYEKQKVCHICKKEFCYDKNNEKEFKNKKNSDIIAITLENLQELLIADAI